MRGLRHVVVVIAAVLVAGAGLVVYRATGDAATASILDKDRLTIGVKTDQPRVGLGRPDGTYEGFDIDVATYIAGRLGFDAEHIRFVAVTSDSREEALRRGDVDLVLATYSITPWRKELVTFGGPYYVAHQDILVRTGDTSIRNVSDLKGKWLCQVSGSESWKRVTVERRVAAKLVWARSYSECVTGLRKGRLDAVSTDDLILAGFSIAEGSGTTMVNAPFTNEKYGVGLKKGDVKGCLAVNRYLTEMYQNGVAETLLTTWFGAVDFAVATTVPQFEGCA
ncbi:amino acid ABC transporter substrate-binding protein (PAAT family) [Actinomadura pelletieri DSM 43383]|uniref:Amino acid ABC transporter substrate-binding protein (PAAT family) n=1 Tax=Actinomadura pelletieri DSM 43383 TaxID=1120940 RepID=A0A495QXU5_9ACTN|nr:glutamate ABC transporter substrate-binding protein [Actinomadura pelletieri]RKS78942.1 amino acid ABC transporter substrate-binding protein (PAAT family) [Actinomadura pelletieri DSM 43383]